MTPVPPRSDPIWLGITDPGSLYNETCETPDGLGLGVLGTAIGFSSDPPLGTPNTNLIDVANQLLALQAVVAFGILGPTVKTAPPAGGEDLIGLLAIGLTAILMIIGLSVDAGGVMRTTHRADDIAAEAARVGGQVIDVSAILAGHPHVLDTSNDDQAIKAAVNQYLDNGRSHRHGHGRRRPTAPHRDRDARLQHRDPQPLRRPKLVHGDRDGHRRARHHLAPTPHQESEIEMSGQLMTTSSGARIRRGVTALIVLCGLILGVPVVLLSAGGDPVPHHVASLSRIAPRP